MGNKKKKKIVKNKNKTFKKQVNNHTNDELKKQVNNHNNDEIVPFSNFPEENQTPQPVENKDLTKNQTNKNKENKPIFFLIIKVEVIEIKDDNAVEFQLVENKIGKNVSREQEGEIHKDN